MSLVSMIPFTDILKLVVAQAKKVKDFKPLFKELASTIERLVPIFEEIDLLQERLEPGNKELIVLTKLMLSAKKMVRKCSRVRVYNLIKINSYTKKIKQINADFVKFCQIDLQLIRHRDQLRSRSQLNNDQGQRKQVDQEVDDDDEQLSIALRESQKNIEELSSVEAEELQKAIQESISLRRQQEKQVAQRKDEEQRILWESFKDTGKRKQLEESEELSMRQAIQESISLHHQQVAKRRVRKVQKHKQIKNGSVYNNQRERIANGSSSMGKEDEEEQGILWESLKEKEKTKQVQEDELVALALQESLNPEEPSMRHQQEEQAAKRTDYNNASSSSTRELDEDDIQLVLWESLKKRQRKSI